MILALACGLYFHLREDKPDQQVIETIVPVTRGDIEQVITSQGKLEPKEYVDVGVQVSGQLKKLAVDVGDNVKKGDLIAEIDPKIYNSRVEAAEGRLKTLEAQLAEQAAQTLLARQQADRNRKLFKSKAVSQELAQTSDTNLKVAQARLVSLQAQIDAARSSLQEEQTNLDFTTIYAPIDGTVVVQTSREGQTLNANQMAPVIVQLANLDTMTVRAQVAEADVLNVKEGMDVYFTILGNLKRKWLGKVRQVLPSPQIVNAVVLYDVLVDVDNNDRQLMTGMTTQMFFVQGQAKNALLIPSNALVKPMPEKNNANGNAFLVRVLNGKKKTEKIVYVGLQNRNQAEIREGLTDKDRVVIEMAKPPEKPGSGMPRMGPRL